MKILYDTKNDLYAFGYNSAESELISIKSRTMWAKGWDYGPGRFWAQSEQ